MNVEKTITKIRMAVTKDAVDIVTVLYEAFEKYKPLYTEKGFVASTPGKKEIEERINKKIVWIATSDKKIAGTVSVLDYEDGLFIRSMAVSPGKSGKGIGKALMEHVHDIAFARSCSALYLNTTPFLSEAIGLYKSFGFKELGPGDLYGTPLINMKKDLEP